MVIHRKKPSYNLKNLQLNKARLFHVKVVYNSFGIQIQLKEQGEDI